MQFEILDISLHHHRKIETSDVFYIPTRHAHSIRISPLDICYDLLMLKTKTRPLSSTYFYLKTWHTCTQWHLYLVVPGNYDYIGYPWREKSLKNHDMTTQWTWQTDTRDWPTWCVVCNWEAERSLQLTLSQCSRWRHSKFFSTVGH